ncbi:MAG: diaminopimelate epimerase [Winogradskyella sp.]|uniref:diaminopimelate epimerase n=1 Tax=Winogradskyella sp. TaxID=1883156 RepID=UPI0017E14391|nr:diaminopimelate epimerase [Winogradskyella sp.]MBT8245817.1 diaminopimelate epimerase [Winogradskyella sp.]NNK22588.1 diaminopimelate epimerase [Winogradskyella sp.]
MTMNFYKYQGTGNDFIIIDNRSLLFDKTNGKNIAKLCDRRFGIGADGLILLENHPDVDFRMVYYNADGNESSMCGNGGRCITAFAKFLGVIDSTTTFEAIDGMHKAQVNESKVSLQMKDVSNIETFETHSFLDTGSPHHVQLVNNLKDFDVKTNGEKLRYGSPYKEAGSNINFVNQISDSKFAVRTYERGVEDETLSCGTGVTAVAIAMHKTGKTNSKKITLETEGGELKIAFEVSENGNYHNIWLIGPATQVFKGETSW